MNPGVARFSSCTSAATCNSCLKTPGLGKTCLWYCRIYMLRFISKKYSWGGVRNPVKMGRMFCQIKKCYQGIFGTLGHFKSSYH